MHLYYLMAIPFGIGGVILTGIAAAIHRSIRKRRKRATVRTDAVIVEKLVRDRHIGERNTPYYIYEFSVDGTLRRAQFAGKHHQYLGDTVTIYYDPEEPEVIYIPEAQRWAGLFALYFIGICWLLGAFLLPVYAFFGIE